MSDNLENVLIAALLGLAGWFVKDFLFGLVQKRNQLERLEWEYRLKEIYCPLYFWSGLLAMRTDKKLNDQICEHLHDVMAKATYLIPKIHYYALIRLIETAHDQGTSGVAESERNRMRGYLYDQIEVLNFVLYRSEQTGGVGDPITILSPYRRLLRLLLMALSHVMVWLLIVLTVGGVLWLYQNRYFALLGSSAVLLLLIIGVDTGRRARIQRGIAERINLNS
jgi:hypothetical protein